MHPRLVLALLLSFSVLHAADDFPLTEDSKPHEGIPKGEMLKGNYIAKEGSLFPGTEREYQIYVPAGLDKTKPAPFMVFQDGVIYQAPTVFDNLIAKKDIPAMIGIFIKPGVVPAANDNALPRYNRSYEYDSVTDNYARFLIDEFLPAIVAKHQLTLSDDPNARGIAGNSSGGIAAFMVAWHRPDQFRRVFSGVGTYVGIHGADQLPVLVRKFEPKPLRVYLQSGENDNNLYCGDWWLANQMMERSLTWNGYDVNHTWGTGGHNAKHATQIFPDVLRWLWKDYPAPVKANPRGDAKWRGYEVIGDGEWKEIVDGGVAWPADQIRRYREQLKLRDGRALVTTTPSRIAGTFNGSVVGWLEHYGVCRIDEQAVTRIPSSFDGPVGYVLDMLSNKDGSITASGAVNGPKGNQWREVRLTVSAAGNVNESTSTPQTFAETEGRPGLAGDPVLRFDGFALGVFGDRLAPIKADSWLPLEPPEYGTRGHPDHWDAGIRGDDVGLGLIRGLVFSPDQSIIYVSNSAHPIIHALHITNDHKPGVMQAFGPVEGENPFNGFGRMCVDTNGWLYVATSLGIQVLDQCGRVNFIIPTPKPPHDVCFGGKDLSDLFIACGDTIYKRPTKAHGYISGQMAPIKPPSPKL